MAGGGPSGSRAAAAARVVRRLIGSAALGVVTFALTLAAAAVLPGLVPGWSAAVVSSGSMSPGVPTGSVIVNAPFDGDRLATGAIVTFWSAGRGGLVTHRVVGTEPGGTYVTRGDRNRREDSTPVLQHDIRGVGRMVVPLVGLPAVWWQQHRISLLLVAAAVALLAWRLVRWGDEAAAVDEVAVVT